MKRRRWPDEQEDEDGGVLLGSASSVGVKQHWCHEYWCHEYAGEDYGRDDYGGDEYEGDVPQRALALCVGEQRALLHVPREGAHLPSSVVLHEHG